MWGENWLSCRAWTAQDDQHSEWREEAWGGILGRFVDVITLGGTRLSLTLKGGRAILKLQINTQFYNHHLVHNWLEMNPRNVNIGSSVTVRSDLLSPADESLNTPLINSFHLKFFRCIFHSQNTLQHSQMLTFGAIYCARNRTRFTYGN